MVAFHRKRLEELLIRTGYAIVQSNGQRIYYNPNYDGEVPGKGCEIFVGKLPRDLLEDELVPIFENLGTIYQLRLMMDFNGRNRGYCFVTFLKKEVANMAVILLNGYEIRRGCKIGIFKSLDNTRLFVSGIPVDRTREEVKNVLGQYIEGIKDVIMYSSLENQNYNRGYVFVEFGEHRMAAIARRRLQPGSLILWNSTIIVDWADPLPDTDPLIMSKVTKLYIRNINIKLSSVQFRDLLFEILDPTAVIRVHKINDYAFVHFVNRESAEIAKGCLQDLEIEGRNLEVAWARPEIYSNNNLKNAEPNHFCLSMPSRVRRLMRNKRKDSPKPANISPNMFMFPTAVFPQTTPLPNYATPAQCGLPLQHNFLLPRLDKSLLLL